MPEAEQTAPNGADSPSIADRIAEKFGLNDEPQGEVAPEESNEDQLEAPNPENIDPEGGDETAPTPEDFVEIETDEGKFKVPKALEPAILRQKDYTQKTQTLAQREKQLDVVFEQNRVAALRSKFEVENAQVLQQLQAFDSVLNQVPDWSQVPDAEVPRQLAQRQAWKDQREQLANQLSQKYREFQGKENAAINELKTKAHDVVSKAIPKYDDALAKALREHAKSYGYSDAELSAMDYDPRHAPMIYKAMQYDKLMASKAQAVQTANKAPPMVKPGTTRPMPQGVKNDLALAKAQKAASNPAEKAKIIAKRLEGRF